LSRSADRRENKKEKEKKGAEENFSKNDLEPVAQFSLAEVAQF
jgi:hypothetical protein